MVVPKIPKFDRVRSWMNTGGIPDKSITTAKIAPKSVTWPKLDYNSKLVNVNCRFDKASTTKNAFEQPILASQFNATLQNATFTLDETYTNNGLDHPSILLISYPTERIIGILDLNGTIPACFPMEFQHPEDVEIKDGEIIVLRCTEYGAGDYLPKGLLSFDYYVK